MTPVLRRQGLVLGALTAIGGLGIDMYLPALPLMAVELGVPIGTMQLTLSAYLLALALGQPFYGPLSDRIGRRAPMTIGLILFGLSSIGCALARDVTLLIGLRFLQGLGASALMVVSRAVVRDLCTGATAVRLMAIMIAVVGVAPIVSPVIGGLVAQHLSWRLLFAGLAVLSVGGLLLVLQLLPETRPVEARTPGGLRHIASVLRELCSDRRFLGLIAIPGLTQASTFAFVASSAFVFVDLLHMTAAGYSLVFAITSVALIGGAQFSGGAVERFGAERVVLTAILVDAAMALLFLVAAVADLLSLGLVCFIFLLTFGSIGFIGSPSSVLALEPHHRVSGTAASLAGGFQMLMGALGSGFASALANGSAVPLAFVMSGCTLAALLVAWRTFSGAQPAVTAAD